MNSKIQVILSLFDHVYTTYTRVSEVEVDREQQQSTKKNAQKTALLKPVFGPFLYRHV